MTSVRTDEPINGHYHTSDFAQGVSPEEIARTLGGDKAHRSGKSWATCCPAHDDRNPSLILSEAPNGELLFHCHAGCSQLAVLAALRRDGINVFAAQKMPPKIETGGNIAALERKGFHIAAVYDYRDEGDVLLYQIVRLERYAATGERTHKTFRQRRPHPDGTGWIENLNGIRRVPYKLPEVTLRSGEDVHLTEGEKDADALAKLGLLSCSIKTGAEMDLKFLRNRRVSIHEDNDQPGRRKAAVLAGALREIAASVRIVSYAEVGDRGDVSDWLAQGHTLEDLLERIEQVEAKSPPRPRIQNPNPIPLLPITLDELLNLAIKPREFVIEPLIHKRGLVMVFAWRGVGKTWFALGLGYAIATGGKFLRWAATTPRRVLHVCGEMPAVDLKDRLERVAAGAAKPREPGLFRIISADLHDHGIPDLATLDGQAAIDAVLGEAEVVIFANVSTLFRTGQENELESWVPVQNWLLKLRREGRTVVIIHHSNKAKAQRGTSKREDVLDVVLNLRAPSDYEASEGARFEVHFEKARGLSGTDAVSPFEAKLEMSNGAANWTMRGIEDARHAEILELKGDGWTVRKIAAELGMSKSAVQRVLSKSSGGD